MLILLLGDSHGRLDLAHWLLPKWSGKRYRESQNGRVWWEPLADRAQYREDFFVWLVGQKPYTKIDRNR